MTSDDYPYWDYEDYYNDFDGDEQYYMELLMELRQLYREHLMRKDDVNYWRSYDWESGV